MGRLHTLYYLQILKSKEDAKKAIQEAQQKQNEERKSALTNRHGPTKGNIFANRRAADELAQLMEEEM